MDLLNKLLLVFCVRFFFIIIVVVVIIITTDLPVDY